MKLNKTIKKAMREAAVKVLFDAQAPVLRAEAVRLADGLYAHEYNDTDLNAILAALAGKDRRWLHWADSITLHDGLYLSHFMSKDSHEWNKRDDIRKIWGTYGWATLPMSASRPFPHAYAGELPGISDMGHPLHEGFKNTVTYLYSRAEKLIKDSEALANEIDQLLASIPTLKKLEEVWPEGTRFLPPIEAPVKPIIPVNLTDSINARIFSGANVQ